MKTGEREPEGNRTSKRVLAIGLSVLLAAAAVAGLQLSGETETPQVEKERQARFSSEEPQVSGVREVNDELQRRVLAIKERVLGREHPSVATSLNALADLYEVQGRYAQAEQLYRRVLAMNDKALGRGHPDVARRLANYGVLLRRRNQEAAAQKLEALAEAIRAKQAPEDATGLDL